MNDKFVQTTVIKGHGKRVPDIEMMVCNDYVTIHHNEGGEVQELIMKHAEFDAMHAAFLRGLRIKEIAEETK